MSEKRRGFDAGRRYQNGGDGHVRLPRAPVQDSRVRQRCPHAHIGDFKLPRDACTVWCGDHLDYAEPAVGA